VHGSQLPSPLDPEILLLAYRTGIFPMADAREDPEVFWVEPRRRAILPLDHFHCSHSLAKVLRRGTFEVTCNRAFERVIVECAAPRRDEGETWISGRIEASYVELHRRGLAHSVECWRAGYVGDELVGGLYGVGFDRVFCGESMFSRTADASKVALAWLVAALRRAGSELLDCQFMTDHLASMGAVEISQSEYLERLRAAQIPTEGDAAAEGLGDGLGEGVAAGEGLAAGAGLPSGFAALLADAAGAGLSSSPGNFIAQSLTQTS
jgi:leucyl/phenylalanyl-tRNA--protein transferase